MGSRTAGAEPLDANATTVAPGEWLRNRRRTHAWAAICGAWAVLFAALILLPGHLPDGGSAGEIAGVVAVYAAIVAAGLWLGQRVARAGVWLGPDAIVIRGPFRTQSVALGDAERFAPGLQGRGGNGVPCPMLARRHGSAVGVWALGQRNIWFRYARMCDEIEPLCDELNALVADLQAR
jgi:hypothetical protein